VEPDWSLFAFFGTNARGVLDSSATSLESRPDGGAAKRVRRGSEGKGKSPIVGDPAE
jgi:hypothetical protein